MLIVCVLFQQAVIGNGSRWTVPGQYRAMEDLAQRSLKYGDTIYLKVDGKQAFVSGHDKTTPQVLKGF